MIIFGSIAATILAFIICAVVAAAVMIVIMRPYKGNHIVGYKLRIAIAWAFMFTAFLVVAGLISLKLFPPVSPM
ncbi:MAG TPA: hypothetical protein VIM37_00465 [Candidatus Microsaccharimonas sp.]|jgi:hypothetical protein